jgi:glycosyltransferase involved in cell wall biosynthesis
MKIIIEDGLNLYKKTGQGQYSVNFYNILTELGYEVEMKRKPFLEKIKNSTIKRILYVLWINIIFPVKMIFNNAEKIIFTNTITPIFKMPHKKYYPVLHDLWAYKSPETVTVAQSIYARVVCYSIKYTYEKIITVSETAKRELVEFYKCPEDDISVVYNYFSFGEKPIINSSEKEQSELLEKYKIKYKNYILSVSTLNKRKNIPMLINAYNKINTGTKLVLVGNANSENFKNVDISNPNIIFTGYISDDELKVLYKNALLYVFPSVYEGFGIPLIDAQSFGVPVLCSDIPVFREIANNSALFSDLTVENLAFQLDILLNDEAQRNLLIKNGYQNIQRFNKEVIKEQILENVES